METIKYLETTVTSTRIRLARNISGYNFPSKLSTPDAKEIIGKVGKALNEIDDFDKFELSKMTESQMTLLQEKYLISPALIRNKDISAAFITKSKDVSIMVNEEDHLREQYIFKGFDLYKAYERLSGIDDELENYIDFAYNKDLGYLTACPSNLGTGMRASVMMFLPGLAKYGVLKDLMPSLKSHGLTVRGGFGEGSTAEGWSYQISNEKTLGSKETDILYHMDEVTLNLTELESRMREKMLKEDRTEYLDTCLRAFGKLTNCAILPIEELTEDIISIRLGVALGFFKVDNMDAFNDFIANMRPQSFRNGNCPNASESETNELRAEIVSKYLPKLVTRIV